MNCPNKQASHRCSNAFFASESRGCSGRFRSGSGPIRLGNFRGARRRVFGDAGGALRVARPAPACPARSADPRRGRSARIRVRTRRIQGRRSDAPPGPSAPTRRRSLPTGLCAPTPAPAAPGLSSWRASGLLRGGWARAGPGGTHRRLRVAAKGVGVAQCSDIRAGD